MQRGLLGNAEGLRQRDFRQIEGEKATDIRLVCGGDRFLRLHHLEVIGHARAGTVLRLGERLVSKVDVALCYVHEFGGGLEVEEGSPHLVVNLALQVGELRLALLQR